MLLNNNKAALATAASTYTIKYTTCQEVNKNTAIGPGMYYVCRVFSKSSELRISTANPCGKQVTPVLLRMWLPSAQCSLQHFLLRELRNILRVCGSHRGEISTIRQRCRPTSKTHHTVFSVPDILSLSAGAAAAAVVVC
ncbi:hypothetical protein E2C01_061842 [Portunus trituberculatus]|uniref:Uncharacterized protein n=1 Tax=Portunus trituberculatus TaxID=210409 RepID=A0A5B7HC34_PORTR|nr:hypothetical protein [Portunus trituberculatus]